jgi:hypothetical protein
MGDRDIQVTSDPALEDFEGIGSNLMRAAIGAHDVE